MNSEHVDKVSENENKVSQSIEMFSIISNNIDDFWEGKRKNGKLEWVHENCGIVADWVILVEYEIDK